MFDLNNIPTLDAAGKPIELDLALAPATELAPEPAPAGTPKAPQLAPDLGKPHTIDGQINRLWAVTVAIRAGALSTEMLAELAKRPLLQNDLVRLAFLEAVKSCTSVEQLEAVAGLGHVGSDNTNRELMKKAAELGSVPLLEQGFGAHRTSFPFYHSPSLAMLDVLGKQPVAVQAAWVRELQPSDELPAAKLLTQMRLRMTLPIENGLEKAISMLRNASPESLEQWRTNTIDMHRAALEWMRATPPWDRPSSETSGLDDVRDLSALARNKTGAPRAVVRSQGIGRYDDSGLKFRGAALLEYYRNGPVANLEGFLSVNTTYSGGKDARSWGKSSNLKGALGLSRISDEWIAAATDPRVLINLAILGDSRVANSAALNLAVAHGDTHQYTDVIQAFTGFGLLLELQSIPPASHSSRGGHQDLQFLCNLETSKIQLTRIQDVLECLKGQRDDVLARKLLTPGIIAQRSVDDRNALHSGSAHVFNVLEGKLPAEEFVGLLAEKDKYGRTPAFYISKDAFANATDLTKRSLDLFEVDGLGSKAWEYNPAVHRAGFEQMVQKGMYLKAEVVGKSADSLKIFYKVTGENGKDYTKKATGKVCYVKFDEKRGLAYVENQPGEDVNSRHHTPLVHQLEQAVKSGLCKVLKEHFNKEGNLESLTAQPTKEKGRRGR